MDIVDQPLQAIIDKTGHRSPELGGSTASILAALLGLSLIRMAIDVSHGSTGGSDPFAWLLALLDRQSVTLAELADADQDAFQDYMKALKQPREPQRSQDGRATAATGKRAPSHDEAVSSAKALATQIPVQAAQVIVEALELVAAVADKVKATVASDIFGGAALLHGALTGVLLAVDINLKSGGPLSAASLPGTRDDLGRRGKAAYAQIRVQAEAAGYQL